MSTQPPSTATSDRFTWISLYGGAAIWFVHLNIVYPLTSLACQWGWLQSPIGGLPGLKFIQIIITVVAAALLLITIYLPWRNWRRFQTDHEYVLHHTEKDRRPLVAFITMILNGFFFLFVVASFVPVFTLNPCG